MDLTSSSSQERSISPAASTRVPGAGERLPAVGSTAIAGSGDAEWQRQALDETRAELEFLARRYADFCEHLTVAHVTLTPEGRMVEANAAAAALLDCERPKLIGNDLSRYLDALERGRFVAHLEMVADNDRPMIFETGLNIPGHAPVAVQLASRRVGVTRRGERQIHTTIVDTSQLKQTQRMLDDISREQDAFNEAISHDLRAPLVTIANYARIVLSEHGETLDEESREMIERIERNAGRMQDTLRHLLEYSALGREEITLHRVDLDDVVRSVLTEYREAIQHRAAEITVASPLPPVHASRLVLAQAVSKLLTNALRYTAPGQPPRIHLAAETREGRVVLKIRDQGIGIDPAHHERIFRLFERLHGYAAYPGSGVGLAIVHRAVERMHGKIWVESQLAQGSCFCLQLPAAE
jgi:signal transduction histidine kinase